MKRLGLAAIAAVAALMLTAAPASAHAQLDGTQPQAGAVLDRSPARVELSFSEAVEVSFGSIRVYDADGARVDTGRAAHPDGRSDTVALSLPELGRGAYVVTWRVISADSHPVHGAFTFRVGAGADTGSQALAQRLLAAEGGSTAVGAAYGAVRFAAFASLVLLIGGVAFLLLLWPAGWSSSSVRRLLIAAWALAVLTTAAGIALQGVYGGGLALGDMFRWSVVDGVLHTRFGHAWLARLVLLLAIGHVLVRPRRSWSTAVLVAAGAGILVTPGIAGHPGADHPAVFTVALDALHLTAVSLWLGGLAMLSLVVLRRAESEAVEDVVPRFSRLAFAAVVTILATGTVQGWRQARSLDAVTGTTYGRLLLVKLGLFALMVALAAMSRAWVRGRTASPDIAKLRRSVMGETAVAVVVLMVTALLVNAVPARNALAQPFSTELRTSGVLVDVTVDPAKAGPVDIHVYVLTQAGEVTDVEELTATLTLPGKDIGPLVVPLQRAGTGHFSAYGFELPLRGTWLLDITVRTSDIDQSHVTAPVRVR